MDLVLLLKRLDHQNLVNLLCLYRLLDREHLFVRIHRVDRRHRSNLVSLEVLVDLRNLQHLVDLVDHIRLKDLVHQLDLFGRLLVQLYLEHLFDLDHLVDRCNPAYLCIRQLLFRPLVLENLEYLIDR